MRLITPSLVRTYGEDRLTLSFPQANVVAISLESGSAEASKTCLDLGNPKTPPSAGVKLPSQEDAVGSLVSAWDMAGAPGMTLCASALEPLFHSSAHRVLTSTEAIALNQEFQVPSSLFGAIPPFIETAGKVLPRLARGEFQLFDEGTCQLLTAMCRQDPTAISRVIALPIHSISPTPQWIHLITEDARELVCRRVEFVGLADALDALRQSLERGEIRVEKNLLERLLERLRDRPIHLVPAYGSALEVAGQTSNQMPSLRESDLLKLIEHRGSAKLPRAYFVDRLAFRSERDFLETAYAPSVVSASLEAGLSELGAGERQKESPEQAPQPKWGVSLASRIGALSVESQASYYQTVEGRSESLLRPFLPVKIPPHVFPLSSPESARDPFALDFGTDRGADSGSRYRSTTYRWVLGSIQLPSSSRPVSAEMEVRIHTKVSDNLTCSPPSCVITLFVKNRDKDTADSWVLLNLEKVEEQPPALSDRALPLLRLQDGSVWLSGERKRRYHHLVNGSASAVRVHALRGAKSDAQLAEARALFAEAQQLIPLLHFPVVPEVFSALSSWTKAVQLDRLTQIETLGAAACRTAGPIGDPGVRDYLERLVRENPEQPVIAFNFLSVLVARTSRGYLLTARADDGQRAKLFEFGANGAFLSSSEFLLDGPRAQRLADPPESEGVRILDEIAKIRLLQHLRLRALPYGESPVLLLKAPELSAQSSSTPDPTPLAPQLPFPLGAEFSPLLTAMRNPKDPYTIRFPITFAMHSLGKTGYFTVKHEKHFTIGGCIVVSDLEHTALTFDITYDGVILDSSIRLCRRGSVDTIPLRWNPVETCISMLKEVQEATLSYLRARRG